MGEGEFQGGLEYEGVWGRESFRMAKRMRVFGGGRPSGWPRI